MFGLGCVRLDCFNGINNPQHKFHVKLVLITVDRDGTKFEIPSKNLVLTLNIYFFILSVVYLTITETI